MKIALAAMATAVAALVVVLASASREAHLSGEAHLRKRFSAGPVAASPSGSLRPAPDPVLRPVQATASSQPQAGTPLPRSEPLSSEAADAGAASPSTTVVPASEAQVAALQQLVAQSQQESYQLGQIDGELMALRQRAANEESRRQYEADQMAAQHAATLEALGILRQAEELLATGNSDGVDEQLGRAEAALAGRTRLDVEAAREALARSDLYPARQYLAAALAERRVPR
jgi:hypothetical protein